MNKESIITIRVSDQNKAILVKAATDAGMSLSEWLVSVGLDAASPEQPHPRKKDPEPDLPPPSPHRMRSITLNNPFYEAYTSKPLPKDWKP